MSIMHDKYSNFFKPYQTRLFWYLVIIGVIILIVVDIGVYFISFDKIMSQYQDELITIAVDVTKDVPVSMHELIQNPDQQKSTEYKSIETYFQAIVKGNPKIDDIYTLRPTTNPDRMTFVVSAMPIEDSNKNGIIDEEEMKPQIGEFYDISDFPAMKQAIDKPSVDEEVTFDKWGAWLSGYAPLKDGHGTSVGIVGVDYSANVIVQSKWMIIKILLIANICFYPLMFIVSYLISRRLTRPLKAIGIAMEHIVHGELEYAMPYDGLKEDKMFADLFNNMKEKLINMCKR